MLRLHTLKCGVAAPTTAVRVDCPVLREVFVVGVNVTCFPVLLEDCG